MREIFEAELSRPSVFLDRDIISPHHLPEKLPHREKQMEEISKALAVTLRGKKPANLFLYGKTGTGKTSVSKKITQELIEYAKQKELNVESHYLNCRTHNSKYKVLLKAVHAIMPGENLIGYSAAYVYEKIIEKVSEKGLSLILVLDEVDKVKDIDELIYSLTRANDDLERGSISILGISNNLFFKDRLDPRTRSALCEQEMVFPPYNAQELKAILEQRALEAFKPGTVTEGALALAAAYSAQESGDARTAVLLLLKAGEEADQGKGVIGEEEVRKARQRVEEEIIFNMISTLPLQQQLVLYSISDLSSQGNIRNVGGGDNGVLFSGDVYENYARNAKTFGKSPVSSRWYREYLKELQMYGLITTTESGKGIRGTTTLIKLGHDKEKIKEVTLKEIGEQC